MWIQKKMLLDARPRGFHIITDEVTNQLPEMRQINCGILHVFIQHTSASLTVNENADPSVRSDLESHFNQMVPENQPYYRHTLEGPDDMPSHIKAALLSSAVSIPVENGNLALGTWQGIYLCEHRNRGRGRNLVLTLQGE
ncbi:MAG: secondary thiamine-phosphate synthase enzyme YjbQ [Candidatus Marinimicrobia bacterium]|jgi:secondary thiamine-phosphate synthase enzyme|nr:secondary thiamine-phosphate synthase enzyme YjbQ [Candidatus Neomarinimicrobiota bacterium]MDP6789157.1 secondary thiamine-phosphate synthase enzyme YjbQ [Candidatus Neomarinimicrobiota bacterium]MDP7072787.1 secondary thiamine-phosphate synthase enzyme YjbQ [Candidatus Neomarinimicrobiota bacterium]